MRHSRPSLDKITHDPTLTWCGPMRSNTITEQKTLSRRKHNHRTPDAKQWIWPTNTPHAQTKAKKPINATNPPDGLGTTQIVNPCADQCGHTMGPSADTTEVPVRTHTDPGVETAVSTVSTVCKGLLAPRRTNPNQL